MFWLLHNKLTVALVLVVLFLVIKNFSTPPSFQSMQNSGRVGMSESMQLPYGQDITPQAPKSAGNSLDFAATDGRMVSQESYLSLVVLDVRSVGNKIIEHAKQTGGHMVNASYNQPEESPFASITIRVPSDKMDATFDYLRNLSVKVSSEQIMGTDITESYSDINARLQTLQTTEARLQDLLARAIAVEDILNVQRELLNTQQQIEYLNNQKGSLEQSAQLTKITIYLSTDEFALPYVSERSFRPEVIFKQAVRSLVETFRFAGEALIWVAVYSIVWLPILIVIIFLLRRSRTKL